MFRTEYVLAHDSPDSWSAEHPSSILTQAKQEWQLELLYSGRRPTVERSVAGVERAEGATRNPARSLPSRAVIVSSANGRASSRAAIVMVVNGAVPNGAGDDFSRNKSRTMNLANSNY